MMPCTFCEAPLEVQGEEYLRWRCGTEMSDPRGGYRLGEECIDTLCHEVPELRRQLAAAEERIAELTAAVARISANQEEDFDLVAAVTRVVRQADQEFESFGGSSRHWVRDHFLPELNLQGMLIVREAERRG